MMTRKLFSRMTTAQEQMANSFVAGDMNAYEKAEKEQMELFEIACKTMDAEQRQAWSETCSNLDKWVSSSIGNNG